MSLTLIAGILLLAQLGLLAATMWLRYLGNKNLFKSGSTLTPSVSVLSMNCLRFSIPRWRCRSAASTNVMRRRN